VARCLKVPLRQAFAAPAQAISEQVPVLQ